MHTNAARSSEQARFDRIAEILSKGVVALAALRKPSAAKAQTVEPEEFAGMEQELAEIARLAADVGKISIGDVMSSFNASRTTAHRRLTSLVEQGVLVRKGKGRASRYSPHA